MPGVRGLPQAMLGHIALKNQGSDPLTLIRASSVVRHRCRTSEDTLQDARIWPIECLGARFARLISIVIVSPVFGGFV